MQTYRHPIRPSLVASRLSASQRTAFSLVELLTVIFIISLLIAILLPSLGSARNAAKKAKTSTDLRAIGTALELFKNDNEQDFGRTNGYPSSFAHPRIKGYAFDAHLGEFPFSAAHSESSPPSVTGAHWLPAMLMGADQLGYVQKSVVPHAARSRPWRWYTDDPLDTGSPGDPLPRAGLYMEPGSVKTVLTKNIRGRRNEDLFVNWDEVADLPVMVDGFDQPILYYVANKHGRTTNMVAEEREENNAYSGGTQLTGPPYYFHQDNMPFTGRGEGAADRGWDYGGGEHAIAESGHALGADEVLEAGNRETFVRFLLDRALVRRYEEDLSAVSARSTLKPVNADKFILISAGTDGRYGTPDDVTNFPLSTE